MWIIFRLHVEDLEFGLICVPYKQLLPIEGFPFLSNRAICGRTKHILPEAENIQFPKRRILLRVSDYDKSRK
jgi:hypothetical protein